MPTLDSVENRLSARHCLLYTSDAADEEDSRYEDLITELKEIMCIEEH